MIEDERRNQYISGDDNKRDHTLERYKQDCFEKGIYLFVDKEKRLGIDLLCIPEERIIAVDCGISEADLNLLFSTIFSTTKTYIN